MREIKFRAQSVKNGIWVIGYYLFVEKQNTHYILTGELKNYSVDAAHPHLLTTGFEWVEIIPETLCQVTSRLDKDKIFLIFENDIVEDERGKQYVVTYWEDAFKLQRYYDNGELGDYSCDLGEYLGQLEIVGTIFDKEREE